MNPRLLPLLILMASLLTPASAARADEERHRVPTVTRLVQLFSTLEIELMNAVREVDTTAIGKMLADDFELRGGGMPGNPIPRAEWLRQSQGQTAGSVEQMAVHDYGAAATVSYLWKRGARQDSFVVDIWAKSGDAWKLSVRYASPAANP